MPKSGAAFVVKAPGVYLGNHESRELLTPEVEQEIEELVDRLYQDGLASSASFGCKKDCSVDCGSECWVDCSLCVPNR